MKIEKFKKRPNGLYTIYLDNFNSYDIYEEIILKYELLITKTIKEEELNKIIKDNKNYESYYDALKTLKRTIKTKEEIRKLLTEKKYSKENISFAINTLEKQGYLNDKNYANSYVHNAIITKDDANHEWIIYHGYKRDKADEGRVVLMDRLQWEDGWPMVKGKVPSIVSEVPVIKNK